MASKRFNRDLRDRRRKYISESTNTPNTGLKDKYSIFKENSNWKKIYDWHLDHRSSNSTRSININRDLQNIQFIIIGIALYSCLPFLLDADLSTTEIVLRIALPICLVLSFKIAVSLHENKYNKRFQNKELVLYQTGSFTNLDNIIKSLCSKMEIELDRLNIWQSDSKTYLPSIQEHQKKINLILPMNFFLLCTMQPKQAESMIAHEFGHILLSDSRTWLSTYIYSKLIRILFFPYLLFVSLYIFYLACITQSIPQSIVFLTIPYGTIVAYNSIQKCREYRSLSEELADTLAILFSDGSALIECLETYTIDPSPNSVHPNISYRILKIGEKLNILSN